MRLGVPEKDLGLIKEFFDALQKGELTKAKKLYMKAGAGAKEFLNPSRNMIELADMYRNLDHNAVTDYIKRKQENDDVGMRRIYSSANNTTRRAMRGIDNILEEM